VTSVDLHDRGRLGPSRIGRWLDAAWRKGNQRAAVSGRVQVGKSLRLGLGANVWSAHGLSIGDFCAIGRRATISVDGEIGNFLMTGPHVIITGRADHAIHAVGTPMLLSEWIGERPRTTDDTVVIGDDVWIGSGAIVLGGVTVGPGTVIGAGAVVVTDLPAFAIAVGNPARIVGERFSDTQGERHLEQLRELRESLRRPESSARIR
jgi:acetyltransferase-like isoleucine patch superfamily enzyme